MPEYVVAEKQRNKRAHKVADVVARFSRQKKFLPEKTYGHVYAAKVTELAGDNVELDMIEEVLVALKRRKIISGRRMVNLLGQHQREIRG
ncbi:hypothetical protein [Rhodobacter capsulatus]|uniref:hypothetical protein n=1 Tax=Rhodobacter capsulatus TaxID=1061 RepID=UPI004026D854